MSEFNPEQPHGYREKRRPNKRTRRELLGIGSLTPKLPRKPDSVNTSELPQAKLSRRGFIKKTAIAAGVVGVASVLDAGRGVIEFLSELEMPQNVTEAIKFLEEEDIQLPQDPLYGFTFPSTKEMAQKYKEALSRKLRPDDGASPRWLIIMQKKEPKSSIVQFWRLFEDEWKKEDRKNPKIEKPEHGKNESVYITLPPWMEKDPKENLAKILYHEGYHLFYQPFYPPPSDEEVFNREIPANIAEILMGRIFAQRKGEDYFEIDIDAGYDKAIKENNRGIFEEELRKLYQLPEDCCTYQSTQTIP